MAGIDPPSPAVPPTLPKTTSIPPVAKAPRPSAKDIAAPAQPAVDSARRLKNANVNAESGHKTIVPYQPGSVTYISRIVISRSSTRIGLITPQSTPVRGDVDTDLAVGQYNLSVDRDGQQWVFKAGQTKSGLRFHVRLDGPNPFNFDYPDNVPLLVQDGLPESGTASYKATKARIVDLASPFSMNEAYLQLSFLNEVDLYDIIDEMWADSQGAIEALVSGFHESKKLTFEERFRVLRALESFSEPDKKVLFIDNFDKSYVDPTSFKRADPDRVKRGLWSMQLTFVYREDAPTQRSLNVYVDDILANTNKENELPQYGTGALLLPRYVTAGTCPKMYAAKLAMIKQVETQNYEFVFQAWQGSKIVLDMVMGATDVAAITKPVAKLTKIDFNASIQKLIDDETGAVRIRFGKATDPAAIPAGAKPISPGTGQPPPVSNPEFVKPELTGEWMEDFEGGLNQRPGDAEYVVRASKVPGGAKNQHFYFMGRRFDGAEDVLGNAAANGSTPKTLVELKNWQDGGMYSRILSRRWDSPSAWIRMESQVDQASQLATKVQEANELLGLTGAERIQLVYRVNSDENARLLHDLLVETWKFDLQVTGVVVKVPK